MNIPKEISPCPIIEYTLEIHFKTNLPSDAIVGVVYNLSQGKGQQNILSPLPLYQIPSTIRNQDPNLKDKPTHKLHNNTFNYDVLIGPNVFIITIPDEYKGWSKFLDVISNFITNLQQSNIIESIVYVSLRYLNFFAFDIFDRIKLKIEFEGRKRGNPTIFKTEFRESNFTNALQITSGVHLKNAKIDSDGSLIDISTILIPNNSDNINLVNFIDKITFAHNEEKTLFFSLLEDSYIKELNPKY